MPKARVIARDRQRAQQTIDSLHASGYEVEVVAPGDPQVEPCDLTINLEEISGDQNTYLLDEAESFFVEGEPSPKREFVFAPAWRKLSGSVRDRFNTIRQQRLERKKVVAPAAEASAAIPQAPQQLDYERIAAEFAAQRAQLEASFAAQLEAAKEERRTQGTEILRLQQELAALRQQNEFLSQSQVEPQITEPEIEKVIETRSQPKVSDLKPRFDQWAQRIQRFATTGSRQAGRATVVAASRMRDLTMRPSFSVAAGIVFAFLLGFWAATGKHQPDAKPAAPSVEANVSSASVVPASNPAGSTKPARVAPAPKVRKPSPVKEAAAKREDDGFQEVVVRHYPSRGNIAKTEAPKVKQYSDIEDEQ